MANAKPKANTAPVLGQRALGRHAYPISILGLGGRRLAHAPQAEAIRVVHEAVDHGVTLVETAAEYGDGRAERWLGLALAGGRRDRVTLAVQCCAPRRDYKTAMLQLDASLARLKTERIDLWLINEVIYDNDPDWIYAHGALDAAMEAREQGKVRFIGFSGHKAPHIHLKLLARGFAWDAVSIPMNPLDANFRSFERQVLPELVHRGIGVLATRPYASGAIPGSGVVKADEALRYALSLPVTTVITGAESRVVLRKSLRLATHFKPFHAGEMDELRHRARAVAGDGRFVRYKTTLEFDGPAGLAAHGYLRSRTPAKSR